MESEAASQEMATSGALASSNGVKLTEKAAKSTSHSGAGASLKEGDKIRVRCAGCQTLSEVKIPSVKLPQSAGAKSFRFLIRCPLCKMVNDPIEQATAQAARQQGEARAAHDSHEDDIARSADIPDADAQGSAPSVGKRKLDAGSELEADELVQQDTAKADTALAPEDAPPRMLRKAALASKQAAAAAERMRAAASASGLDFALGWSVRKEARTGMKAKAGLAAGGKAAVAPLGCPAQIAQPAQPPKHSRRLSIGADADLSRAAEAESARVSSAQEGVERSELEWCEPLPNARGGARGTRLVSSSVPGQSMQGSAADVQRAAGSAARCTSAAEPLPQRAATAEPRADVGVEQSAELAGGGGASADGGDAVRRSHAQQKQAQETQAQQKQAQETQAQQKQAQETQAQQKQAQEKQAQEKQAQEKGAQEKQAQEKGAQEKQAQEKGAQEKQAQEKDAQEKEAQEKGAQGGDAQEDETRAAASANGAEGDDEGAHVSRLTIEDFEIMEATERISASLEEAGPAARKGGHRRGRRGEGAARLQPSSREIICGPPSCEEAYAMRSSSPRWRVDDVVEVAWKGKGFSGSWALADVVKLEGRGRMLVRFHEFVDESGSKLVERLSEERLRLPPPPRPSDWVPKVGDKIEGLWNDCWWEGYAKQFDPLKGILFQYERYANWMWLPLRCVRPRPPLHSFYPDRPPLEEEEESHSEAEDHVAPGICGRQGCQLRDNHLGLCQVLVAGTRRESLREKSELQQQEQLWAEIKANRRASAKVAIARAESLLKAEQAGTAIRAAKGNRAQWHANFLLSEFTAGTRDLRVYYCCEDSVPRLVGMLVFGYGRNLADTYHMLRVELLLWQTTAEWHLDCRDIVSGDVRRLSAFHPATEILPLLPRGACDLVVSEWPHGAPRTLLPTAVSEPPPSAVDASGMQAASTQPRSM